MAVFLTCELCGKAHDKGVTCEENARILAIEERRRQEFYAARKSEGDDRH